MTFLKKQTVGFWMTVCTLLLGIISFVAYNVNITGEGYFHGAGVATAARYMVIAIVLGVVAIVLTQLPVKGIALKVANVLSDIARIASPALFIGAVLTIVSARVEGFAFIYFSNPEVLQEVQTPANISSAHGAMINIACLVVAAVVGIVSAFFSARKVTD